MAGINDGLSIEDLSRRTGEPPDQLTDWRRRRLVGLQGDDAYRFDDVERIRLIQQALRRGFTLDQIVRANDEQNLLEHYLGHVFPNGVPPSYGLSDVAEETGVELDFLKFGSEQDGEQPLQIMFRNIVGPLGVFVGGLARALFWGSITFVLLPVLATVSWDSIRDGVSSETRHTFAIEAAFILVFV